ncbi:hypothetical protein BDV96DRAFT_591111 [Lophiotrema nucula]|uniref:Uncharacterized protein n=1 Tax=Lophiotrema nucula TaxID=690887 RepID=A0A6A5YH70_9PLEO|nr:hypothetical protein BDV96DRAFT_591111 [Lophiotrema nucula]
MVLIDPTLLGGLTTTTTATTVATEFSTLSIPPASTTSGIISQQIPSTGLSNGAKIAVGIAIPLIAIIAATVIVLFIHRARNRRARSNVDERESPTADHTGKPELEGDSVAVLGQKQYGRAELAIEKDNEQPQDELIHELGAPEVAHELPAEGEGVDEIPAKESSTRYTG